MDSLPLRHRVGQLLIMGLEGPEPSASADRMLTAIQPGGIILFARNIVSAQQTHALLSAARQRVRTPIFSCLDLEGGTVDRLRQAVAPAPSASKVAHTYDRKLFEQHGRLLGEESRALGFNTDFAPSLDLDLPPSRNVLTSRTVSGNPKEVVTFARRFLKGLSSAKVLGCGKHFPGLGEANLDTHKEFPSIRKPWKALWEQDLYPFRELKNILPMMMVSHAGYPEIDDAPASLSRKWITGILRKKIGYEGLVLSDDLEMGGVLTVGSIEDVAIETLKAGADIFLVCNKEELVWRGYEAVLQRAERDKKFERLVNHAAERVLRFKKKARELKSFAAAPDETTVARLRENMQKFTQLVEARTRSNA